MDVDAEFKLIEQRTRFCELVADGVSEVNAAFEVGWTPVDMRRYLADRDFAEIVDAARQRADGTIQEALFRLAKHGHFAAQQMWLYNRNPAQWRDVRRVEVRGTVDVNHSQVAATKAAVIQLLREQGAGALQAGSVTVAERDDDIQDAEVVDPDDER